MPTLLDYKSQQVINAVFASRVLENEAASAFPTVLVVRATPIKNPEAHELSTASIVANDGKRVLNQPGEQPPMLKRILIVEDSPVTQRALSILIRSWGFLCDVVSDGEEALAATRMHDYAVIILDLRLPYMDGFQAASAIREDGNDVPIIAQTAYVLADDVRRCREVGIDRLLWKGAHHSDLLRAINFWSDTQLTRQVIKESSKRPSTQDRTSQSRESGL